MASPRHYAHTNVQLYDQLRREGYPAEDRDRVSAAYNFAMRLFAGLFLPSGKVFLDHLVGTASILAALHVKSDIVIAGLLHAAYLHGDFGLIRDFGITPRRRWAVNEAVGETVERYIARYHRFPLDPRLLAPHGSLIGFGSLEREVLLMRLANLLEHNLHCGVLYYSRSDQAQVRHQRRLNETGPIMIATAERLGYPDLAADLRVVFEQVQAADLPVRPRVRGNCHTAFLVPPASHRERLWLPPVRRLFRGSRRIVRAVSAGLWVRSRPSR